VLHLLADRGGGFGSVPFENLAPGDQVSPQPVEGLLAQAGAASGVECVCIRTLPAAGEGGGAGGVVVRLR